MSVFTHGVTTKGKPRLINRNQVFTVLMRRNLLSMQRLGGSAPQCRRIPMGTGAFFGMPTIRPVLFRGLFPLTLLNPLYCGRR
jgi:hypothetical protein